MFKPRQLTFLLVILLLWSCKTDTKYGYAIKDFRKALQPHLTEVVSKGIVTYFDSSIQNMITDKELIQLGKSEHPVLRATAFREMLQRKSFNHFDIIMSHLDDTAIIAKDAGEWGIWYRTVSDDILEEAKWKDTTSKNKTIDEVIRNHHYLRSAYTILSKIQLTGNYYPYIKEMAVQKSASMGDYKTISFEEKEQAFYALAKYKKPTDIPVIKDALLKNAWIMSESSFRLMKEFPDSSYLDVLETYYPRIFYRNICINKNIDNAVNYIQTVATYKNNRSAAILESILNKKPFINCAADTSWLKETLITAIWENPCEAYEKLRLQIKMKVIEDKRNRMSLPINPVEWGADTAIEKIRW